MPLQRQAKPPTNNPPVSNDADQLVTPFEKNDAILARLLELHPKVIDLSLGRVLALLEKLGNPQDYLPPVVHVAGTNAKGSVIAYMRAALEAQGFGVHVHISPHLVRFVERIRLSGELISEEALSELLEGCERINAGEPITFFEITTAAALVAFASTEADVVLLETGLGGRLDATNVVKRPAVCVITPISMDHQQFLGDSLSAIGREKAGILKRGTPAVIARQPKQAMDSIVAVAQDLGVALYRQDEDWSVHRDGDRLVYQNPKGRLDLPLPNLIGPHQVDNAGIALAALDRLAALPVSEKARAEGLTSAQWPGRLQRLTKGPLMEGLADGWELWLDGGHNEAAAHAIAAQAEVWAKEPEAKPLLAIFGMLNSKDPVTYLAPLADQIAALQGVAIPGEENALDASVLVAAARGQGIHADPAISVKAALDALVRRADRPARILVCGSLYLAGTVLSEHA